MIFDFMMAEVAERLDRREASEGRKGASCALLGRAEAARRGHVVYRLLIVWVGLTLAAGCDGGSDRIGPRGDAESALLFPIASESRAETDASSSADRGERADIISMSPSASRFLISLGVGERITAVGGPPGHPSALADRPRFALSEAEDAEPGWLFVPSQIETPGFERVRTAPGTRVVEFAPHDLEDLFALLRWVGPALVGSKRTDALHFSIARPLSLIAAESHPTDRPRVLAVVSDDPMQIAGGHHFSTDLIEIAGGSSVTHGGEDHALAADATSIRALGPDLIVLMLDASDEGRIARLTELLPIEIETVVFEGQVDDFWSAGDPAASARSLRAMIERFSSSETGRLPTL